MRRTSEFARPVQELVTEYCWGTIWTRDGLDRRTRSLVNLAMLTALNRTHELGLHVRGAVINGATTEEIREVLLQTAVYAWRAGRTRGVPHRGDGAAGARRDRVGLEPRCAHARGGRPGRVAPRADDDRLGEERIIR